MNLIEIKNNLAKLSYTEDESPILGRFIVFVNPEKSYVAQLVNLKSDTVSNYAIAKLIFTFNSDGVVADYDGSIPSMTSEIGDLPASELLNLLPVENPIKFGKLAQQDEMLSLDVSIFEGNLTVFTEKDSHKKNFISNCIRQLFQQKEKSVIVDHCNLFEDYAKIKLGEDYKLPLNSKMIDFLFEYELTEVDSATKAVIQDIFYAVQQYIDSLDFKFLPIDNFVDVVTNQYKELQMPELALLKNKLLKYRDTHVFANTKEEVLALEKKLKEKNCSIVDVKDIPDALQKEVISYLHSTLDAFDKYVYLFVSLNDDNSDKKMLKQFINHNHIFTTVFVSSEYKYANELKQHAQNIFLFAPQNINNDFAAYSTFLSKLNPDECVAWGQLTQGIPFIVEVGTLRTDLTQDDVLGDRYQFIPVVEQTQLVRIDEFGNKIPVEFKNEEEVPALTEGVADEPVVPIDEPTSLDTTPIAEESIFEDTISPVEDYQEVSPEEDFFESPADDIYESEPNIVEPVSNIMEEEPELDEDQLEDFGAFEEMPESENYETGVMEPEDNPIDEVGLTEDDLDYIENSPLEPLDEASYEEDNQPTVPVYLSEDSAADGNAEDFDFAQGDTVTHSRYGRGVVQKIIKYGNKTLCAITFDNVGRRLLDPTVSELVKI